ncbi:MAG: divergent polysaccharide deacetylase family protein [Deltaproteobacteria bacterium]|nr:divergent polysaccharide deacetylase family protein [Deltaproteobacteria bacterium]
MAEKRELMDRRHFLYKSAYFFAGSLLGLNSFSKARASDRSFFQPRIAIIIDDIGFSRSRVRRFLELGVPITFAVLPRLTKSSLLAEEINVQGHELMLHQPMEPYASVLDPGPGAIYVGDGVKRIANTINKNMSSVPCITGVNNHMGSRFTACQRDMSAALQVIKQKGLFFIDSVTSSRSTAYQTAKTLKVSTAFRNVFLDNRREEPAILSQLHKLKKHAMKYGHAIGIGHPYPETARAIGYFTRDISGSRASLVHVSSLTPA